MFINIRRRIHASPLREMLFVQILSSNTNTMLLLIFFIFILTVACAFIDNTIKIFPNFLVEPLDKISGLLNMQSFIVQPEDATLTTMELISKYGYNGELHKVTTSDGYILELHRITGPVNSIHTRMQKPVVFLMHGILCSSAIWVFSGKERSLAFILADAGYDVWLGNARGSLHAREHEDLKIQPKQYWNFSWHEIGIYDLPAMIDYALKITNQKNLFYLGHSQGTTSFFVMASECPEYQRKIKAMFAMAPIVYCGRMYNPFLQLLSYFIYNFEYITTLIGIYELELINDLMRLYRQWMCSKRAWALSICWNPIFLIANFNIEQFDMIQLLVILNHLPAGTAAKQLIHYGQLIKYGEFRQYDHGTFENIKAYGAINPPNYDIKSINVPIALYYSDGDWLANVKDVEKLHGQLSNRIGKFLVSDYKFGHLDFMWGKNAKKFVYDLILRQMKDIISDEDVSVHSIVNSESLIYKI